MPLLNFELLNQEQQWALMYALQESNKVRQQEIDHWTKHNEDYPNDQQPVPSLMSMDEFTDDLINSLLSQYVDQMKHAKRIGMMTFVERNMTPEQIEELAAQLGIPPLIQIPDPEPLPEDDGSPE